MPAGPPTDAGPSGPVGATLGASGDAIERPAVPPAATGRPDEGSETRGLEGLTMDMGATGRRSSEGASSRTLGPDERPGCSASERREVPDRVVGQRGACDFELSEEAPGGSAPAGRPDDDLPEGSLEFIDSEDGDEAAMCLAQSGGSEEKGDQNVADCGVFKGRHRAPAAASTSASCPGTAPKLTPSGGGALMHHQPRGLIDVGVSQDESKRMVLRTVEAQDVSLFAPPRSGKLARLAGVLRRSSGRPKLAESGGGVGPEGEGHEAALPRETVLVPAADETVRMTLKPWLRDSWKIRGEISTITEEMGEDTIAEVLKDVCSNRGSAAIAARHLCSYRECLQLESTLSGLCEPGERQQAMTFALSLEDKLQRLYFGTPFLRAEYPVPTRTPLRKEPITLYAAIITLQLVKDVLLVVLDLTEFQGLADTGFAGLSQLQPYQLEPSVRAQQLHYGSLSALSIFFKKWLQDELVQWWNVMGTGKDVSLKDLVVGIHERKVILPFGSKYDGGTQKAVDLMAFAAKGIRDLRVYGDIAWFSDFAVGHVKYKHITIAAVCDIVEADLNTFCNTTLEVTDSMETRMYAISTGLGWKHILSSRYFVSEVWQAAAAQEIVSSPPQVYHLHPALHSVTMYAGCALKPFCEGCREDGCCDRIRRSALRDKHGMAIILASKLLIILNFKTSNACVFAPKGQMFEGASTISPSVKAVDELVANGVVEEEMEIDRSQAMWQVKTAKDDNAALGMDPNETYEWEGTAMVAAATWLKSTYLLLVGNCWYIRQNPRWKRLWKLVLKFVRQHRLTGMSILSVGISWNTVIVTDRKIITFLCEKMRAVQNGWHEVTGSKDIEGIVRATAGDLLHLNDNVLRLCRSTIEASIAHAKGIRLTVFGRFSGWRHLYTANKETDSQEPRTERPVPFEYLADDPHQVGGRSLWLVEGEDGYYVKLRNAVGVMEQRWYKLRNAPESPVLGLNGLFRDDLTEEERMTVKMFDAANRIVSIGTGI